jgi:hypothetical protein
MSEEPKQAEVVREEMYDGEGRMTKDGKRRLSEAFVKHIGKPLRPEASAKGRETRAKRKPLGDALNKLIENEPWMADAVALRLMRMALLGRGEISIQAIKLLFERMDGKITGEAQNELPSVNVSIQNVQRNGHEPQTTIQAAPANSALPFDMKPETVDEKREVTLAMNNIRKRTTLPPTPILGPLTPEDLAVIPDDE